MTHGTQTDWPIHGRITGPIVMIGFGSIGRGTLPLIERHFDYDRKRFTVIDPSDAHKSLADKHNLRFEQVALTADNFRDVLTPLLTEGGGQGFCVNLSVDTSSRAIMELCRELGALYIDTVAEPWTGFYFDKSLSQGDRTNYALRENILAARHAAPGGTTAVSCCGANPGMVSWFVKQALLNVAKDTGSATPEPTNREGWAALMQELGVKGVHIAERDTQRAKHPKPQGVFVNTWSVEGFVSEGNQPAELGWGTHEAWKPENAREQEKGSRCAIYLLQPGADTRVRSWTPTAQSQVRLPRHPQRSDLDLGLLHRPRGATGPSSARPATTPTTGQRRRALAARDVGNAGKVQERQHILDETEIEDGIDELGVLLYGHAKNAYWLRLAALHRGDPPHRALPERHRLQVTSAVLAGMVWAIENPNRRHRRGRRDRLPPLSRSPDAVSRPRRRRLHRLDPTHRSPRALPEDIDESDPWQFRNVLVHG